MFLPIEISPIRDRDHQLEVWIIDVEIGEKTIDRKKLCFSTSLIPFLNSVASINASILFN